MNESILLCFDLGDPTSSPLGAPSKSLTKNSTNSQSNTSVNYTICSPILPSFLLTPLIQLFNKDLSSCASGDVPCFWLAYLLWFLYLLWCQVPWHQIRYFLPFSFHFNITIYKSIQNKQLYSVKSTKKTSARSVQSVIQRPRTNNWTCHYFPKYYSNTESFSLSIFYCSTRNCNGWISRSRYVTIFTILILFT